MADQSFLEKLGKTVANIAPIIGSLLPIPGAAPLLNIIKETFGGATDDEVLDNISKDPNAYLKLKEIEKNYSYLIERLQYEKVSREYDNQEMNAQFEKEDREDARKNSTNYTKSDNFIRILYSILPWLLICFCCCSIANHQVQGDEMALIGALFGFAFNAINDIKAWYYGSSFGSKSKDAYLSNISLQNIKK